MQDESQLLGLLGTHVQRNAISHKAEKEGKPHGKKPSPKKRDENTHDVWMDGVIKTPPLRHTSSMYKRE